MVDRVCYGAVVDYIFLNYAGVQWPAIFNFADVMITLGCVLIIFESFTVDQHLMDQAHR